MELPGPELVLAPEVALFVVGSTLAGAAFGLVTGLVPGLHANNVALLLASVAPGVPAPPLFLGCAMLAAGVVHSFTSVVPALALGVPDAEMAPTAVPGHRLVLEGAGREAIRLSALGSALAVCLAVPLAIPVTLLMEAIYPTLRDNIRLLLGGVVAGLLVTERTRWSAAGGALSFALAAGLGLVTLDLDPDAPLEAGGILAPLFAGLFGAPFLIDAMRGGGVPPQREPTIRCPRTRIAVAAVAGTVAGALVGYLPGISAAIAGVAVLVVLPGGVDDRGYVIATSGVTTANAIFALFALVTIGRPRSGVMVAVEEVGVPLDLPVLVASVVLAGAVGFVAVLTLGERYFAVVARADHVVASAGVLCLLVAVSGLLTGFVGVAVFVLATAIGLVPVRFGAYRVHLMGVLIGPLLVAG